MIAKEKVVFCWSGGKDSALALNRILNDASYDVLALLSTCNEHFERVSMHGVRVALLDRQAQAIGLPLEKIFLSRQSSNDEYQQKMSDCLLAYEKVGRPVTEGWSWENDHRCELGRGRRPARAGSGRDRH